jgi:glucose-6-phosphate 1-dehydrogenase
VRTLSSRGSNAFRPSACVVIFGATGELADRKLLPTMYNDAHEGSPPERFD